MCGGVRISAHPSRSGNTLRLATRGKGTKSLSTDQEPAPMLVGTSWTLAWDVGADGSEHPAPQPVVLVVRADGSFIEGLSCGRLSGAAQISSLTIRFTKVSRIGCASGTDAASQSCLPWSWRAETTLTQSEAPSSSSTARTANSWSPSLEIPGNDVRTLAAPAAGFRSAAQSPSVAQAVSRLSLLTLMRV